MPVGVLNDNCKSVLGGGLCQTGCKRIKHFQGVVCLCYSQDRT